MIHPKIVGVIKKLPQTLRFLNKENLVKTQSSQS
jgi:hypothetical protein